MFKKAIFKSSLLNLCVFILGIIYLLVMSKLLFFRGRIGQDDYMYNLIPFKTIKSYIQYRNHLPFRIWFDNLLGNIVLFIPIGLVLPFLNRIFLRPLLFIVTTLLIIFGVELIQILTRQGSFDVDDMILNTFGACLGLGLTILTVRSVLQGRKLGG